MTDAIEGSSRRSGTGRCGRGPVGPGGRRPSCPRSAPVMPAALVTYWNGIPAGSRRELASGGGQGGPSSAAAFEQADQDGSGDVGVLGEPGGLAALDAGEHELVDAADRGQHQFLVDRADLVGEASDQVV